MQTSKNPVNSQLTNKKMMNYFYMMVAGMMDGHGHGQIARKNDGQRAVPVPVFARTCPFLKKVTLPVFAREFCSGNCPRLKVTMKCYLKII